MFIASLVCLSASSMYASSGPQNDLLQFLRDGSATQLLKEKRGTAGVIAQLDTWAKTFRTPEDLGAYHSGDANQTTLLGKFACCGDLQSQEVMRCLLDTYDADPEAGVNGKTPRAIAKEKNLKDVVALFDETIFLRRFDKWVNAKISAEDVTSFFAQYPDTKLAIDTLNYSDGGSVIGLLEDQGATDLDPRTTHDDAKITLAHCAPYLLQGVSPASVKNWRFEEQPSYAQKAFTYLVVGCCEYTEDKVPLKLLKSFLADYAYLPVSSWDAFFERYTGMPLDDYLKSKLGDPATRARTKVVCAELKTFHTLHPLEDNGSAHLKRFWVMHNTRDSAKTNLLLHCLRDEARHQELEHLLLFQENPITLASFAYDDYDSFADYVNTLSGRDVMYKDNVMAMLNGQVVRDLFRKTLVAEPDQVDSRVTAFVQHVVDNSLDIDTVKFSDGTIGGYLDNPDHHEGVLSTLRTALQPFRSNPPEAHELRKRVRAARIDATKIDALKEFIKDKRVNIDLIKMKSDSNLSIARSIDNVGPEDILDLPAIESYRTHANTFGELLKRALVDQAAYEAFEELCSTCTYDVDVLLHDPDKTLGQLITDGLNSTHRAEALAVAELVQRHRSDKSVVFRTLYRAYEKDPAVLSDLKSWVKQFHPNADKLSYNSAKRDKTIGDRITERLSTNGTRTDALAVALLVQDDRSKKDVVFQALCAACENDPTALGDLESWVKVYKEDVDTTDYDASKPGETIGRRITEGLRSARTRKRALAIALIVQEDRSNQLRVFQTLCKACESDATAVEDLKTWVDEFEPDVDQIADPAHEGKTIGDRLTERLSVAATRKEALAVARIVQHDRTNQHVVLQTLFKVYESDSAALDDLEGWLDTFKEDVDKVADQAGPNKTIGECITEKLRVKATRKDALDLARLVWDHRSNKNIVLQTLYTAYENDTAVFKDLENWVNGFEEDVDTTDYDPTNPGMTIGGRIAERLSAAATRKDALAVAEIVQMDRSDKESVLRTLYAAYEKDQSVFDDLKEWQRKVDADVTTIRFDPALPETIAQRIEALGRDDLSNLFKITATAQANPVPNAKPNAPKQSSWSMGKTLGVAAVVAGAGFVYYYMINKNLKKNSADQPQALPTAA